MDELTLFSIDMDGSMEPDEGGRWVRYEDVAPMLSELAALKARLAAGVEIECDLSYTQGQPKILISTLEWDALFSLDGKRVIVVEAE